MTPLRKFSFLALATMIVICAWPQSRQQTTMAAATARIPAAAPPASPAIALPEPPAAPALRDPEPQMVPLDRIWNQPVSEPTFAAFHEWATKFKAGKAELSLLEGVRLAQRRHVELADLIDQNPRRALELAVPWEVRRNLPEVILAELEERVAGRGDLLVAAALATPGKELLVPAVQREVVMRGSGRSYRAFTFGRRTELSCRDNIAIQGIALDGKLALSDLPGRLMEASEVAASKAAAPSDPLCPTSGLPTDTNQDETVVDWDGEHHTFYCGPAHAVNEMLAASATEAASLPPIAAANGSGTSGGGIVAESTYTEGSKKMLIMRVDFPDKIGQVVSDATLTTLITNFNTHWTAMSYGKTTWALVGAGSAFTPTLRLPLGHASYTGFGTMLAAARAAAEDAGFDYRSYQFDVVVTGDKPDVGFGGIAFVGGRGAWLANSQWNLGVGSHEVGHNFGLNHAGYWNTDDGSVIGSGAAVEYGNPFDQMGGASSSMNAHFGARQKNYLDWLPDADVRKVTTNGTFTHRISAFDKSNATGARVVAVDRASTTNDYWVEYRQLYAGSNKWIKDGVLLHWGPVGINNAKPILLDTTAATSTLDDSALLIGQTFADPTDKIYITPVAKGADANGVTWVDVTVNRGDFAGNLKPTVTIVASPNNPAVNASTTFTATASDPNGDPLSYFWDWGSGNFTANNSSTASTSWTTSGIKTVRCIVSDMKGLVATGSALVQVGTTSTFYISGVVKSAANTPLVGVTVRADATHSDATDSEGYFAITDLAAGNYTVTATSAGLQFTNSGFTNPVAVGPSKQNINFTALPGAPSFGTMKPGLVDQGSNTGAVLLPVNDPDTAATALTLTGVSSDPVIIPNANIVFTTVGTMRAVTVTAPATVNGTANITLTASDGATTATYVWPVTVNAKPVLTPPVQTTPENTLLNLDLRTFATDDLTSLDRLRFDISRVRNGSLTMQPDGHTALFTPTPDFHGTASFTLKTSDQSLSSRTLILWDFEAPDTTTDSKVDDLSNFNRKATLQAVGNGEFSYVTAVPPRLAPFSKQALSLTENGVGNAARATRALAVTDLNINDADWSFTAWMRRVSTDSEDFILHLGDGDGHGTKEELSCYFVAGSNALHLAKFGTAGLQQEIIGPDLGVSEWHHVGVIYDRTGTNTGALKLYVDGFLAGSVTVTMGLSQSFPLVLGGTAVDTANTDRWFDGLFDDVMLSTGVLSTLELGTLAQMGAAHQLGLAVTTPITINVTGTNQPPVISDVLDVGLNVGQASAAIPFSVGDAENEARTLTVSASSSDLALLPAAGLVVSPAPLGWTSGDIGAVGAAGSFIEDHGTFIVAGSGADIGGTADEFRYHHQPLASDGAMIVRVREMDFTNEASKAGIMVREGTAANAVYAMVMVTPGSGVSFQARTAAGNAAVVNATVNRVAAPCWLKLTRAGSSVTAFYAPDSGSPPSLWTALGTAQTIPLTSAARVGLAVSSKVDATLCTAVFDQISGLVNLGGERTVTLTPAAGQSGTATVSLTVNDGTATRTDTFLAVIGINTPPTVSAVSDVSLVDGASIPAFTLTVGDLHTPVGNLVLSATTTSSLLLPVNRITFSGTGTERTVNIRPVPGEVGSVTVTLNVSDGTITTARSFTLTVTPGAPALLVPAGGNWRYLDTGVNPTDWRVPGFIDSAWPIGPAQLGYGDTPADEETLLIVNPARTTTYFRRTFNIADIYAYTQLKLRLLRDDGVVIYLNGQEILRDNMPTGTILPSTSATAAVSGAAESAWWNFTINQPPLLARTNTLAVELHQSGTASSDLSFDLEVLGSNPAPDPVIPLGAAWHYLDDGTDPGTTWKDASFVETAAWKAGSGQLGYGDGDETTVILGGPSTNRFTTSYFRQAFTVTNPTQVAQAVVRYLRDDGVVIYLNGQEIIRDNLPTGPILNTTKAVASVGNADESAWHSVRIDPTRLLAGNNLLAAEVHQSSVTSTDVSFDLQLQTYAPEALPLLRCTCTPTTVSLNWPMWAPGWQLQSSPNLSTWTNITNVPAAGQGQYQVTVPRATAKSYYRLVSP